jgi:peptide/nickel transport system permease protein
MEEDYGLHIPFAKRVLGWLWAGLTLSNDREAVLHATTNTVFMVGTADLLLFLSIPLALILSRQRGKFLGGLTAIFASVASAPSWIHGILLIFLFVTVLGIFPYPAYIDASGLYWNETLLITVKHGILPVIAIFLSTFFQLIYTWRTFFMIYSQEDYIDLARAKGLSNRMIDRKYILRPTLPYIVTNFLMLTIGMWTNVIALEVLFKWPGLGQMLVQTVNRFQTMGLLSIVAVLAYLLAITVFVLDFLYALLDPRVRIGEGKTKGRVMQKSSFHFLNRDQSLKTTLQPASRSSPLPAEPAPLTRSKPSLKALFRNRWNNPGNLNTVLRQPVGAIGLLIVLVLVGISLYMVATTPAGQAITSWRPRTSLSDNPQNALPVWVNLFRRDQLPETIIMDSGDGSVVKQVQEPSAEQKEVTLIFSFDYPYDGFPQEIAISLDAKYRSKSPFISMTWLTPDGRQFDLGNHIVTSSSKIYLSQDEFLQRKLGKDMVLKMLFGDPGSTKPVAVRGKYQLQLKGFLFETDADLDAKVVLYGKVFGLAGTDQNHRNLMIPVLQGLPVALTFGILGALVTSILSMLIAAVGVWWGGWVDEFIQRICEVNMTLPALAVILLVFLFVSKSIWTILGVLVLLNIFGSPLKNYRAALLPVKEAPFIEAAMAQGASSGRIIARYFVPHILPLTITQLIISVPIFVYYEATLSFLGVSDSAFPTWGRAIYEALNSGDFMWYPHRFLVPLGMIMVTGLGFALLGMALEQVLNPRLRAK